MASVRPSADAYSRKVNPALWYSHLSSTSVELQRPVDANLVTANMVLPHQVESQNITKDYGRFVVGPLGEWLWLDHGQRACGAYCYRHCLALR